MVYFFFNGYHIFRVHYDQKPSLLLQRGIQRSRISFCIISNSYGFLTFMQEDVRHSMAEADTLKTTLQ